MSEATLQSRLAMFQQCVLDTPALEVDGRVVGASGLTVEVAGIARHVGLGDRIRLIGRGDLEVPAEIVSFQGGVARAMPFTELHGIGPGCRARVSRAGSAGAMHVDQSWLGRIVDPLGRPLDDRGPLTRGPARPVRASPPDATKRARLGAPLELGVRALDLFATMRSGQRLGLFAGSGVGKSSLLSMLARGADCDVAVIALVGERGREVREFVEDDLGDEGLARSVVVVATSDMQPIMRRQAGFAAMTIAEMFRDQGKSVLFMMDSVTRFCLASREIGLSAGEPPATRGYPPSVFADLPKLLERAGPGLAGTGPGCGSITGLFTVLVEGDDHNEPIADAVRGILDGHVVMDRAIGEAGRYPAVDVIRSLSRAATGCLSREDTALVKEARALLSRWLELAELVRLGAYRAGSDPKLIGPWNSGRGSRRAFDKRGTSGVRSPTVWPSFGRWWRVSMRLDALRSLLKIRKTATEASRMALSEAISAETGAGAKLAAADLRIRQEADAALSLGADDGAVEVYARWLPRGRFESSQARSALDLATHEVSISRTALSMARAAEHAIALEIERAEAELALRRARKAQRELDEIGSRSTMGRSTSGGS